MNASLSRSRVAVLAMAASLLLGACGALPDKPQRATLYDFGPGADSGGGLPEAASAAQRPAITLPEIDASGRLDGTQMLYRLGYADAQALRAYSQARWSLPPSQLLRQRLRDGLAAQRTVLALDEAAGIARTEGRVPDVLRITLDEFSHYFESPSSSGGLVRVRATLLRSTPAGDRVIAQRSFSARSPASTNDAPGGVKALAAASDAMVRELAAWIDGASR